MPAPKNALYNASLKDLDEVLRKLRDNKLIYDIKCTYRVEGDGE